MSISDRDLEALSAYLDGELSEKEQARLEANIQRDEELRNTLERLQHTRTMMRSLPKLRAPRNYYLTPTMVGEKHKPRRAFPVLRFASVLATLLLVLLFLGDVFVLPNQVMAPARTMQFAESAVEEVEQLELEAETIEGQLPEVPAEQSMDRLDMEGEAAPPAAEAMISPSVEPTPGLEKLLATALPAPAEEMEDVIGGAAEPEEEPDLKIEMRDQASTPADEIQPGIDLRTVVRITELLLIVVALTTGFAAFFLYRKYK
jgi:hypothetical protein